MTSKASYVKEQKPHKVYYQHISRLYAYVRNINSDIEPFFSVGTIWKRSDIMSANRGIHSPFRVGDIFIKYVTGAVFVLDKRRIKCGQLKPYLRQATDQEATTIQDVIPLVERELKWRKGSYCESTARVKFRTTSQYTYTSNAEQRRRNSSTFKTERKQKYSTIREKNNELQKKQSD